MILIGFLFKSFVLFLIYLHHFFFFFDSFLFFLNLRNGRFGYILRINIEFIERQQFSVQGHHCMRGFVISLHVKNLYDVFLFWEELIYKELCLLQIESVNESTKSGVQSFINFHSYGNCFLDTISIARRYQQFLFFINKSLRW